MEIFNKAPDEIIILAKGESKRDCPHDAEVWGVKDVGSYPECAGKRMDYIFDFEPRLPKYRERLPGIPIVSFHDYADIKYPLEEVQKHFTSFGKEETYFTNTVCYQIALALHLGVKKIRLYGADAPFGYPYFLEKAGIEYWIGIAKEYGAEVIISEGSHLCRTKDGQLYGLPHTEGSVLLYLSERMMLMQLLPKKGSRTDCYNAHLTRAMMAVTVEEAEAHGVAIDQFADGSVRYRCDHEFTKEIWLPDFAWKYLQNLLKSMEVVKNLPDGALALYDKLVLYGRADEQDYLPKRVSFVLGTKNRWNYLQNAFENLKTVVTEHDELIVVDGGSTDKTKEVINNFGKIITKVVSEPDAGPAHAFNKGVMMSTAKYVFQCCDDDIVIPNGIDQAVSYMEANPQIDLLVCLGHKISGKGEWQVRLPKDYGKKFEDVFYYGSCGNGFLYRRSIFAKVGLLDATTRIPDQEFALRAIDKATVGMLPVNVYKHPIYEHSTSLVDPPEWKRQHKELKVKYMGRWWTWKTSVLTKLLSLRVMLHLTRRQS